MQRLSDRLVAPYGTVAVELEFFKEGKRNKLKGSITGEMFAVCQRCMQVATIAVEHSFSLAFIKSDAEVDMLLPGDEPCLVNDSELRLADIIEDELQLYLPMIVMHADDTCGEHSDKIDNSKKIDKTDSEDARDSVSNKQNAFALLADLKKVT